MTLEYFLLLLMIVSIFTGLVTEGIKKLLEESKKNLQGKFPCRRSGCSFISARRKRIYYFDGCADKQQDGSIPYCADPAFMAVCNGWI